MAKWSRECLVDVFAGQTSRVSPELASSRTLETAELRGPEQGLGAHNVVY